MEGSGYKTDVFTCKIMNDTGLMFTIYETLVLQKLRGRYLSTFVDSPSSPVVLPVPEGSTTQV
ncbi:Hypothetical predicted protein [Marmota monax]|uniref:Uncharacterized protein n=1 Tax=Marmota monax TaxID=9995 RepID=A0A5E4BE85_MARMO|nr:Hypothetical predicted protein [Marmota monax]